MSSDTLVVSDEPALFCNPLPLQGKRTSGFAQQACMGWQGIENKTLKGHLLYMLTPVMHCLVTWTDEVMHITTGLARQALGRQHS